MASLRSLDQVRDIAWGKQYLWDIRFDGAPAPFDEWFPAIDCRENIGTVASFEFEVPGGTAKIPQKSSVFGISLTFHDDEDLTLLNYFDDWINSDIFQEGNHTATVDEIARLLQIQKLNTKREVVQTREYWVYPEGGFNDPRTSASESVVYTLDFAVVGRLQKK